MLQLSKIFMKIEMSQISYVAVVLLQARSSDAGLLFSRQLLLLQV